MGKSQGSSSGNFRPSQYHPSTLKRGRKTLIFNQRRSFNAYRARRTACGSRAPKLYGGTERVVSWLAEELVRQGHRVTLFASAESETAAELFVCAAQSLRLAGIRDHLGSTLAMLREVRRRADDFDVIHFHVDLLPQALFHELAHKCLVTLHGRLDLPDTLPLYEAYPEMPLVSISDAQRRPMPANVNWLATIPHGLVSHVCPFDPEGGELFGFSRTHFT